MMSLLKSKSRSVLRSFCSAGLGIAAMLIVGCGQGMEAEFQYRTNTTDLLPGAQKAVKKALKDGFGTPSNLVAWERFPIDYGGAKGTVDSASGTSGEVTFEGDTKKIVKGAPLMWVSGARAAAGHNVDTVASFDADTKKLTWEGSAEPAPAAGDKFIVAFGQQMQMGRVVYMKNCMHCHGVSGDGNGPTAQFLNPLPRDYRSGTFKFKSTLTAEKPTRDDLARVIRHGIPGTYMPSFLWIGDAETSAVIEYVRWLSTRGEFEIRLDNDLADFSAAMLEENHKKAETVWKAAKPADRGDKPNLGKAKSTANEAYDKYEKEELPGAIEEEATFLADAWKRAEDASSLILPSVPRVTDDEASRERGKKLYLSDKGKCYTCHGVQGRGDGSSTEDFWKKPGSEELYGERGLHDDWGHVLQPRNLTSGQYRGGRRPVDVFRRVYAGIKGTPMPGFGKTALKDDEIWDVVNYVMSLPYQSQPAKAVPAAPAHVAGTK